MARAIILILKKTGSKTAGCTHNLEHCNEDYYMGRDEKNLTGVHYNGKRKQITKNSEQILLEAGKMVQSIKF